MHSHPRYGTVWADLGRVPACYDQSSALGGGELVVVDEYDGPVELTGQRSPGGGGHGVGRHGPAGQPRRLRHRPGSIRAAHQRAVALEYRSRRAWQVEALGEGRPLPDPARSFFRSSDGEGFIGFFEAMARRELRADPHCLEPRGAGDR